MTTLVTGAGLIGAAFARHDGNLASTGAVSFQFLHAGQFLVSQEKIGQDALLEIALAAGADDILTSEQGYEIRCGIHGFDKVAHALEQQRLKPDSSEIAYIPVTTVPVTDLALAKSLVQLHDDLDELDDVQHVFSNEEMDDALSAAAQA